MKVQELLMNIKNKEFKLERGLEVKKYIPVMDKKKFVMDVIAECTDDIDNFIAVDRFKMNIYFDMRILAVYTNLEILTNFDDMVLQYDELCENGMLDTIIDLFKDEYNATYMILEDELEELLIQNSIDSQVVRIANKVNNIIDVLGEALNNFDVGSMFPEGIDVAKILDIVKMLK